MLGCSAPKSSGPLLSRLLFLLFASTFAGTFGSAFAQSRAVAPPAPERSICAHSFAAEKVWYWQRRLSLHEWNISVVVARATDLKPKTLGNIHWDTAKKTAILRVLDPLDYEMPAPEMFDDMEFTVVHELIHLELAPVLSQLQRDEANRRDEEHAVNRMADALLKLERGK